MDTKYETEGGTSGLSTGHLLFVFLIGVAVCAVFFSLGFLVGYNERSQKEVLVSERVTSPTVIPPTVVPVPGGAPKAPREMAPPVTPPAPVATPAPRPPAGRGKDTPAPAPSGRELGVGITVQVTASRTRQDADKMVEILKARGYPVFVVTPEYANAKDNLYRVQVGPFRSEDQAEKVRARLVKEGLKPFIRR